MKAAFDVGDTVSVRAKLFGNVILIHGRVADRTDVPEGAPKGTRIMYEVTPEAGTGVLKVNESALIPWAGPSA